MNVMAFKLLTGEEIIAELVESTGQGYKIKTPLVVHVVRDQGGPALAFARWSFVQKEGEVIHLYEHSIVSAPVEVTDDVSDTYTSQVTGLVLPKQGIVLQG